MDVEQPLRNRYLRIAVALGLLLLGGWAFAPYVLHRVSGSAFVNSELIRVTAPIAGQVSKDMPRPGFSVPQQETFPLINATMTNNRHLVDLGKQIVVARENANLIERQIIELANADIELGKRAEAYNKGRTERLTHEVKEAESERAGCLLEVKQRLDAGSRMDELTRRGLASEIRSAELHALKEAASTRCDVAEGRVGRLRAELEFARRGIFLHDSNDVPYSQQQRDRLFLRRQELELQHVQERSRASQLMMEIEAEKKRLERLEHFAVTIPPSHVVWSTAASPGSAVTEGQTILDMADCEHRFVAVELPERDFEEIKVGSPAAIRLVGSNEWRNGVVQNIRGSAATSDHRLFAALVKATSVGNISVEVSIPSDLQRDKGNFCGIGRLAEVRFPRESIDVPKLLHRAYSWVTGGGAEKVASGNAVER